MTLLDHQWGGAHAIVLVPSVGANIAVKFEAKPKNDSRQITKYHPNSYPSHGLGSLPTVLLIKNEEVEDFPL